MSIAALTAFALILMVVAATPGPSVAALAARVLTHGIRAVLPFLAAMWLGEAIWLTGAVLGLAAIGKSLAFALTVIKWAGVCYLIYLARKMWASPARALDDDFPRSQKPWRLFATGLALTLGNPKVVLFYVALLPTFVDLQTVTLVAWAELVVTMVFVLAMVDISWALLASRARGLLRSQRSIRIANRVSAATMLSAAVAIAAS